MELEDSYKTNINMVKEMILDEEKIVTYITISKDLCLHVNNSKKLLYNTVKQIREEQPNIKLNVSYIISGSSDNNTANTTICTENDLDRLLKLFINIFFYHIYSVCKGSPYVDNVAFLSLNKYEDFSLCTGIIKSKKCDKRTSDEIGNLKTNSQEAAVVLENNSVISSNKNLKQDLKHAPEVHRNGKAEEKSIKEIETKSETKIKTEVTSPKKELNTKQIIQKNNGLKPQKGIASFFNKCNNGKPNKKVSNGISDTNLEDRKMNIDNGKGNSLNTDHEFEKTPKQELFEKLDKESNCEDKKIIKEEPKSKDKNKVKLNKIKKMGKVEKKRKRVLHVSDSEGEEDNDPFDNNEEINNESDDEIPPTPSASNYIKITSGIINPKKKRKVIDKTYTDEDGYILTKKEEVYESCSENEEEIKKEKEIKAVESKPSPKVKKNSPKKLKKKVPSPSKGKQPTLINFFNKK